MTTWRKVGCCLATVAGLGGLSVQAEVKWKYEGTTLTELVGEGETPWKFTVTSGGDLSGCSQAGSNPVVDLRTETLPTDQNLPVITRWTWNSNSFAGRANCTKIYFTETIESIGYMGVYVWPNLEEVELPANLKTLGQYCFEKCGIRDLCLPDSVTTVGNAAFNSMPALTNAHLSIGLESIGNQAFYNCKVLETIDPLLPEATTNIGNQVFSGCAKLCSPVMIGFGSDMEGDPLMVRIDDSQNGSDRNSLLFNGCSKLPSIAYGPGVTVVPRFSINNCSSLKTIEVGPNVTTFREYFGNMGVNAISNVVFLSTGVTTFTENTFASAAGTLMDVYLSGWYEAIPGKSAFGWGSKKVRLSIPGDNSNWLSFLNDPSNVTPWDGLSAADKKSYTDRFGADAEEPFGLTTGNTGGMSATWIVKRAVELDGARLDVAAVDPAYGTVTVSPAPRADGLYDDGTLVTVTFVPATGVEFIQWDANVDLDDPTARSVTIELHEIVVLTPNFTTPEFAYDSVAGTLTDGAHVLKVTKAQDGSFTVSSAQKVLPGVTLNLSKPIAGGGQIVAVGASAFQNNSNLRSLVLPEGLTTLGNNAFNGCSMLTNVVNLIPDSVTTIGQAVFCNCKVLASPAKIGFGTDAEGNPLEVSIDQSSSADSNSNLFGNDAKIPSLRWGPGVKTVPRFATYGMSSLGYLEVGVNVEKYREYASGLNALSNVVILATNEIYLSDARTTSAAFAGGNLREVEMHGWFGYEVGKTPFSWNAKQVRMLVPGDNLGWVGFMSDTSKVTPWADVGDDYKTAYTNRYGETAAEPVGVTVAGASVIPGGTWIVSDGKTLPGYVLTVGAVSPHFGTIAIDPAVPESGLYPPDAQVTVTFAPVEGVTFLGWKGASESKELSVTVTMDENKSIEADFGASFWVYDDGELTDGKWVLAASGAADAITVGRPLENRSDGWLDLAKPVKGGTVIGIAPGNMDFSKTTLMRVSFPETLQVLGQQTFDCCRSITNITPFLPRSITTIYLSAVYGNWALTGDLEIGCGVDAEGNPIAVTLGQRLFADSSKIGPTVRLGRGVSALALNTFVGCTGIRNLVFEGDMPTIDRGAFNCAADQMRIYTPYAGGTVWAKTNWGAYFANPLCVTKWKDLSAEQRAAYWRKYPREEGNAHPYGLTLAPEDTAVNALPANQWVFAPCRSGLLLFVR